MCASSCSAIFHDGVRLPNTIIEFFTDFDGNRGYFFDLFLEFICSTDPGSGNEIVKGLLLFGHSIMYVCS